MAPPTGLTLGPETCSRAAAFAGQLSLLQWMHAQQAPCPMDTSDAMAAAARNNHLEVMQWLHACPMGNDCTLWAVQHGNFAMLHWLRQHSPACHWSGCCLGWASICEDKESLELMQLMLQDHCPWRPEHTVSLRGRATWQHCTVAAQCRLQHLPLVP